MRGMPEYALDLVRLNQGDLRWITEAEYVDMLASWRAAGVLSAPVLKRLAWAGRSIPFGGPVGSLPVHGRGWLFSLCSQFVLSSDVAASLEAGGDWREAVGAESACDAARLAVARATWRLGANGLEWAVAVHETKPIGAPAAGRALYNRADAVVTRSKVGYLTSDVEYALRFGGWPWQAMHGTHGGYVLTACEWG